MAKIREFEKEQISLTQKFSQKGKQFENISNKTNYLEHQLSQEERENKYLKDNQYYTKREPTTDILKRKIYSSKMK